MSPSETFCSHKKLSHQRRTFLRLRCFVRTTFAEFSIVFIRKFGSRLRPRASRFARLTAADAAKAAHLSKQSRLPIGKNTLAKTDLRIFREIHTEASFRKPRPMVMGRACGLGCADDTWYVTRSSAARVACFFDYSCSRMGGYMQQGSVCFANFHFSCSRVGKRLQGWHACGRAK